VAKERIYRKEEDVKKRVKQILDAHQWKWRMPPSNAYGVTGLSDFICMKTGMFMAVEAKFKYNKPTPPQIKYLKEVLACDHFAFVVNEKNVEMLDKFLTALTQAIVHTRSREAVPPEVGAMMTNASLEMHRLIFDMDQEGDLEKAVAKKEGDNAEG
jgi:hypothetical protein